MSSWSFQALKFRVESLSFRSFWGQKGYFYVVQPIFVTLFNFSVRNLDVPLAEKKSFLNNKPNKPSNKRNTSLNTNPHHSHITNKYSINNNRVLVERPTNPFSTNNNTNNTNITNPFINTPTIRRMKVNDKFCKFGK